MMKFVLDEPDGNFFNVSVKATDIAEQTGLYVLRFEFYLEGPLQITEDIGINMQPRLMAKFLHVHLDDWLRRNIIHHECANFSKQCVYFTDHTDALMCKIAFS